MTYTFYSFRYLHNLIISNVSPFVILCTKLFKNFTLINNSKTEFISVIELLFFFNVATMTRIDLMPFAEWRREFYSIWLQ